MMNRSCGTRSATGFTGPSPPAPPGCIPSSPTYITPNASRASETTICSSSSNSASRIHWFMAASMPSATASCRLGRLAATRAAGAL